MMILSEHERAVLRYRFVFPVGDIYRAHEPAEVARILGLTSPAVLRIQAEAIKTLRAAFLRDAELRGDDETAATLRSLLQSP